MVGLFCPDPLLTSSLTAQLLVFARKQVISPRVTDLNHLVLGMESLLRRLIGEHVDLRIDLDPALATVSVDPTQMEQVILNLTANAADALRDGGKLTIQTAEVELDASHAASPAETAPARYVMLAVTDTGAGMDAGTQARIFEPFFTTKGTAGTGIGLSTVHGVVKQSGGHVRVESEPGRGSVFKVYLPRCAQTLPAEDAAVAIEADIGGSETLLVVEDDVQVARAIVANLRKLGYRVLVAQSGVEALRSYEQSSLPIDLMLTDVVMPGINGRELARCMQQTRASMRVLFMSGYADDTFTTHGVLQPGVHFIHKPFTPHDLAARIRAALNVPSARRDASAKERIDDP